MKPELAIPRPAPACIEALLAAIVEKRLQQKPFLGTITLRSPVYGTTGTPIGYIHGARFKPMKFYGDDL